MGERFFELAQNKATWEKDRNYLRRGKEHIRQNYFSARVADLWNRLDGSSVSVDIITAFKRKFGKLGRLMRSGLRNKEEEWICLACVIKSESIVPVLVQSRSSCD